MTDWKKKLYNYGYLLTDDLHVSDREIGLDWSEWNRLSVGDRVLWLHPLQRAYRVSSGDRTFLLVGHAYNPFTMEAGEEEILKRLAERYGNEEAYYDYFDQLTGVFFYAVTEKNTLVCTCDCAGMMGAYYGEIGGKHYYASHCQLIADLCGLQEDSYVTRLKASRLFRLYGWYLPGDLSSYEKIRRVIPNTEVAEGENGYSIHRFYPRKPYETVSEEDYSARVAEIGKILHNNMVLTAEKWKKPAVSLTGGTDSKTTLACASDVQDRFRFFSYISLPREAVDAHAARDICKALGLHHEIFEISTEKERYPDFEQVDRLIERHYGYLGKGNANDVCKRIGLEQAVNFDVEVKSWVSEIARASRYGKYHKKKLPSGMTPRRLTSMYKIFLFNRRAAVQTDRVFARYMRDTQLQQAVETNRYPWSEFFVWEIVFAGWGGLTLTGEHKLTNDITVPYNNRALLDLMLRTPLEKRRTDQLHHDLIRTMDQRIEKLGIHVVNGNETKFRAICEGLYFDIHSLIPW